MEIRRDTVMTLLVGGISLALLAGGAVAVREVGGTDCAVPVVVGLSVESARQVLQAAPIDADVVETREAGDSPEGQVVEQGPARCSGPVQLLVSDGGPAVVAANVPQPYRGLLGDPAADDLVRRITTAEGEAYKSDALLVGECAATRAAVPEVHDGDFAVRCRPPLEQRLLQVVLSATTSWWGEPPSGGRGARSGIADNYMGTAWGARLRVDGWELQVDVTISASREPGSPGPSRTGPVPPAQLTDRSTRVNQAVLTVTAAGDTAAVDVLLTPTASSTSSDPPASAGPMADPELPVTLGELRELADELLAIAGAP